VYVNTSLVWRKALCWIIEVTLCLAWLVLQWVRNQPFRLCQPFTLQLLYASLSWREAFSRSIPPLRFVTKMSDLLPAAERQSLIFPCPGRSDGSKRWEVNHERVDNQEMAGHRLGLRSKSEWSGLLERPLWVWQHDQTVRVFTCER